MKKQVYSVGQVNAYLKNLFREDFLLPNICIKGEVSNCKYHSSGHIYFTLKDKNSAIAAVMFARNRGGLDFHMEDGDQVVASGSIEVYERDGKYQLYAGQITREGAGDLHLRFQKLKESLEEMGMFAPEYKQAVPAFARRIGIVTAPTGAAVRDIIQVARRRNPYVQLFLYPALVQGEGAVESVIQGIRCLDAMGLDVLIVGRGGGSIEDLWTFNEEAVAREIFACNTPVISAVGHQTDTTIADFVADLRAPTPSAAAELAVFSYEEMRSKLDALLQRFHREMAGEIASCRHRVDAFEKRMELLSPRRSLNERRQYLLHLEEKLRQNIKETILRQRNCLRWYAGRLDGLSPARRLSMGYSYVADEGGHKVTRTSQVKEGDILQIFLESGSLKTTVLEKYEDEIWKKSNQD